ncbi:hypothetical protein CXB51_025097 [Gossypium anomalum]|uniref:DUF7745 domain-containing protein n=1 Tax=Gossypium anomalum TaxID=47600 RepID=A0A8J5Z3F6_9ROSI|nr:hypothetical protein CXB51_025097 [Gossypium anomalum]
MEELIIQTTEKNVMVWDWSLKTQKEKRDSLIEGCVSNLPEHVTVNVRQNNLEDLVRIWNQWESDTRGIFTERYGDVANLIAINVDRRLIQAMVRFWDPAYQWFTFNEEDMTPTIEEYAALLRIDNVQFYKIYVKEPKPMTFKKKDLVLNHLDILKRVNLFALAIYGLVVFPKVLGHIEVAVVDFFEKLKQGINPIPTILAETFKSLSSCRRKWERRFIGCAFAPLEAYLKREWPKDVTEEHWVSVFQNLRAEDVTWRALWIHPSVLLYKRQFFLRQFIPATGGLTQSEFAFAYEGYMKRVRDTAKSWKKIHLMELALYANTFTQGYDVWRKQRVNSQQVSSTNYTIQNPFSEEMLFELEMAR